MKSLLPFSLNILLLVGLSHAWTFLWHDEDNKEHLHSGGTTKGCTKINMSKGKQYKWVPEETQFCIHMFADDKCGDENGWSCLVWGPRNLGQSWVRSYIVNTVDGNGNNRAPEKPSPPPQQKPSPPPQQKPSPPPQQKPSPPQQEDPQPPQPPPRATTAGKNDPPPPTRKNEPSKKPEPTGDRASVGAGTEGPAAATTSSTRGSLTPQETDGTNEPSPTYHGAAAAAASGPSSSSPSSSPSEGGSSEGSSSMSGGGIAGVAIGACAGVCLLAALGFLAYRRRKTKTNAVAQVNHYNNLSAEPSYEPELFAPAQKPGYHPSELDSKPTSLGGYPPPSFSAVAEKDAGGYSSWGHVAELADNSSHPMVELPASPLSRRY
ncbi:hypothetical protein I7I48_08547 [Histoplasma ohiense]|nr:hypothetical protein I7I48_08547 [Histoplasma ohiense (nom. inval.)]